MLNALNGTKPKVRGCGSSAVGCASMQPLIPARPGSRCSGHDNDFGAGRAMNEHCAPAESSEIRIRPITTVGPRLRAQSASADAAHRQLAPISPLSAANSSGNTASPGSAARQNAPSQLVGASRATGDAAGRPQQAQERHGSG
jgi:hypothetical protein